MLILSTQTWYSSTRLWCSLFKICDSHIAYIYVCGIHKRPIPMSTHTRCTPPNFRGLIYSSILSRGVMRQRPILTLCDMNLRLEFELITTLNWNVWINGSFLSPHSHAHVTDVDPNSMEFVVLWTNKIMICEFNNTITIRDRSIWSAVENEYGTWFEISNPIRILAVMNRGIWFAAIFKGIFWRRWRRTWNVPIWCQVKSQHQ